MDLVKMEIGIKSQNTDRLNCSRVKLIITDLHYDMKLPKQIALTKKEVFLIRSVCHRHLLLSLSDWLFIGHMT